jgi:LacI family transcriptional regulator
MDTADLSMLHYPLSVRSGNNSDAFLDGRVDGLLFHGLDGVRAQKVLRAGMPAVMLARSYDLPDGCGAAYADEDQTVGLALDHLFSLGHRRIAHLAGPVRSLPGTTAGAESIKSDDTALQRLEAFTARMKTAGDYDPLLIGYADAWHDTNHKVLSIVKAWLESPHRPTAILCANDALACAVVAAAASLDVSIPKSLSVVGIDDSPEAREAAIPLTSVCVPVEEVGRQAVRSLLCVMGGEPAEACRVAVPVTEIVVRGSTAPCGNKC